MIERMRILIAYDGSSCADDALEDMRRAGLPGEAEVLILTVAEVWLPPPSSYEIVEAASVTSDAAAVRMARVESAPVEKVDEEYSILAEHARDRLRSHFPSWSVTVETPRGSPARAVIRRAREWKADLIVVGSHGRTGINRFMLGSVSQKVANEAPCSVRVARGRMWKHGAPVRILIGLDGSAAAERAVEEVAQRVWMMGSEVRLVVAQDSAKLSFDNQMLPTSGIHEHGTGQNGKTSGQGESAWVREFVARATDRLRRVELVVSEAIEEGDPKQAIVAGAEEWGADAIFIGAGAADDFYDNILLGSVATAVVARAHCTVEIVRGRKPLK